ncbi:MAG: PIN domain-containing protein [Caldilineae bacterium]|nr:MAG: PIN domain-containing protein [Caldilineae bacterium]
MTFPSLYIIDANILIDLYQGGILPAAFHLSVKLAAPDMVIVELKEPDGQLLTGYGLQSVTLSGPRLQEVIELRTRYRGVSANDLSALVLARALQTTLLTGDRHLRQAANQEGVTVHGTLWLLDEMIRQKIVTPFRAAQALRQMLKRGRRLPQEECSIRLEKWER